MLNIKVEKSFKKDIKRDQKSGLYSDHDFNQLKNVIRILQTEDELEARYRNHPLKGEMQEYNSVHIKNDWILIYSIQGNSLLLAMLGKHTQVYRKFS